MAEHLYWRINCGSHGSGSTVYSIAEIAFAAASGGPNLAVGGTAIGSAQYSGSYAFAMAFDGNAGTRWASPDGAATAWIGYQFANPVDVAELRITADTDGNVGDAPLVFALEHSDDGITYTSVKGLTASAWTLGQTQTFDVTPLPPLTPPTVEGTHWIWRVNILNEVFGSNAGFAEISMANVAGGANLLTGGMVSASSTAADTLLSNSVDGNVNTAWASTTGNAWWQYEFAAPVAITEVTITAGNLNGDWGKLAPGSWQFQYSDDRINFTTARELQSPPWNPGEVRTFDFRPYVAPLPGQHRWWRIFLPDIGNIFYNFAEIEFRESVGGPAVPVLSPFVGVADNAAANAFDGNPDTNCQMHWINYANFIGADFGWNNYHAIAEVAISGSVTGTLVLQYSDDGTTYVNAITYRAVAISATPQTFAVPSVVTPNGAHLYWRVNIQNSRDNNHICIGEIAMASAVGGANLLTGGVASSSAAAANAAAAIDGDPGTFWEIGAYDSPSGWWQYQFVAPTSVAEIKLSTNTLPWPEVAPDRWQLLYSDDGVTFTWAQSFESGPWTTGVTQTFAVDGGIAPPPSTRRRRPVVMMN